MEGLATTAQVAEYLNVRPNTLDRWSTDGKGPAFTRVNGRRRYDWKAVQEYAGQRPAAEDQEPAFSPTGYVAEFPDGTILPVVDFGGLKGQARVCWNEWGPRLAEAKDAIGKIIGTPVVRPLRQAGDNW